MPLFDFLYRPQPVSVMPEISLSVSDEHEHHIAELKKQVATLQRSNRRYIKKHEKFVKSSVKQLKIVTKNHLRSQSKLEESKKN